MSQFTLGADLSRGRRPGFERALRGAEAEPLYEAFVRALRGQGVAVETGVFGAAMQVALVNDGPATFLLELPTGTEAQGVRRRRQREAEQEDGDAGEGDELAPEVQGLLVVGHRRMGEPHDEDRRTP